MRTDVQTGRTNLIVAFPNFSKATKYPKADYLNPGVTVSSKYVADMLPATPQRYDKRVTD